MKYERRAFWHHVKISLAPLAVCLVAHALYAQPTAQPTAQDSALEPQRYARAKSGGMKLYNLADKNSIVLGSLPAESLLAVYAERAGYLSVEPALGFEAWIYGEYAKPTDQPGLLEITGNNVNLRPLPESTAKSFPLEQRLHKGDRVRVAARANPSVPLAEDWLKVYVPPGTRAWVLASETEPVESSSHIKQAWLAANQSAANERKVIEVAAAGATTTAAAGKTPAQAGNAPANAATGDQLAAADALFNAAKASEKPDFAPSRAAYQKVVQDAPKSAAADVARTRLDEIEAREEIVRIKADAAMMEGKRQEELEKADARLREVSLRYDPLWGRFQARGWLERETPAQQSARYVIRWGGKTVAEAVCTSGRYDLDEFLGSEVGLIGVTLRSAIASSGASVAQPARIDATRLEVISGRSGER